MSCCYRNVQSAFCVCMCVWRNVLIAITLNAMIWYGNVDMGGWERYRTCECICNAIVVVVVVLMTINSLYMVTIIAGGGPQVFPLPHGQGFPWAHSTRGKPRRGMMRRAVFSGEYILSLNMSKLIKLTHFCFCHFRKQIHSAKDWKNDFNCRNILVSPIGKNSPNDLALKIHR